MEFCHKKNSPGDVRLVTFNVNGIKTFFQYHPFNKMHNSLELVFDFFNADIITFQELKTSKDIIYKWGKINGYHSFITIPKSKRGYSGVGCWIKKITDVKNPLYNILQVVKAEEGITGYLNVPNNSSGSAKTYRQDPSSSLGGYEKIDDAIFGDIDTLLKLDQEGRCVMIELSCNTIIISCYCPANSMRTEVGESFRMNFLKVLFQRIRNFYTMGKNVILMGDINVARDIIDSAESMDTFIIPKNRGLNENDFINYINKTTPSRKLFNSQLIDSKLPSENSILLDSTRYIQGYQRLKMYTVWNTILNTRPINYGTRLDYILVTKNLRDDLQNADICPEILGSDHCPVFADIALKPKPDCNSVPDNGLPPQTPKLECKYYYKLGTSDITTMFSKLQRGTTPTASKTKSNSKKVGKPIRIDGFFKTGKTKSIANIHKLIKTNKNPPMMPRETLKQQQLGMFDKNDIPLCKHGEKATLKTSKTDKNPGKKFWACSQPPNASCGYFQWAPT
ncbi:related to DNA-(apurinic or apyrimidinic site) lyase 2 [Saccharomycodes ludwigii]|uniref:DNA-(apurinic or apyrimidinic site) endonuclease 2 n=1 Tax=Saccharomycodes ludwigii TaxID=36035 RepID=A0A376B4I4_9ASCO|nr:hypothetical protein SCDLUD_001589 [Saccharomycodes ludwigii]KAH3901807.1 hypothetical protein SCDLUD_001589 [Saccharomycodes ludwigii]SSD59030.1 related to DNA-(apurinic or apyrimidinic site) lyase 2 [Saccharomycodes ludwigii]